MNILTRYHKVIHTTLTLNSTTLYTLENQIIISKHKLINLNESISQQISIINSSDSLVGSIPLNFPNVNLTLYFLKFILASNDLVTVLTICSTDIPRTFPLLTLDTIIKDFREYRETSNSNVEFKIRFNQIIKFQESEFQRNLIEITKNDLNQIKYVLNDNIEQVLERNERINLLVNKTDRINTLSSNFRTNTTRVKRKLWWNNVKFWAVLVIISIFLLLILAKIIIG
ncbi:Vesicle-associated membrane protein [Wickerhamomyces ciferrii]|uniref:Vesicle-associated membrane protein n=1 Tax=Wickerhamomyces ciferrii (strain ATCC 14091 / BCRC 22168 / CBS 111 / JCM 3599 / NBRC 0793 / NRRL Y-1031 F-60-10) TaxID=1206466 RepID=K0KW61_WICCF|nr:Vesicle-associated membrane protein [Wickerhamomyces ciferrii]CCH45734.1 Vesicle-associated membrane protein [Wickerhamomyces ciferrii]